MLKCSTFYITITAAMPRQYNSHLPEPLRPCSKCGQPRDRIGQRYCRGCHAANMRATRPKCSELIGEAYKRQNARSYTRVYVSRGKIEKKPCEVCGDMFSQVHHEDYNKPLEIRWLCRPCHLKHHAR